MRQLRPQRPVRLRVGSWECSCNTYMILFLRSPKLVGTWVPASVLLEPQSNPGLGPKGSRQGAERRAGFFGPDGLVQKMAFEGSPDGFLEEFSRVTTWERHSRQREQHMRSQGGRRVLAGKGKQPGDCGSGGCGQE